MEPVTFVNKGMNNKPKVVKKFSEIKPGEMFVAMNYKVKNSGLFRVAGVETLSRISFVEWFSTFENKFGPFAKENWDGHCSTSFPNGWVVLD